MQSADYLASVRVASSSSYSDWSQYCFECQTVREDVRLILSQEPTSTLSGTGRAGTSAPDRADELVAWSVSCEGRRG